MPTLNRKYNELLAKWGDPPECEACGSSLVSEEVFESCEVEGVYKGDIDGAGWICNHCADEPEECECGQLVASHYLPYHGCYATEGLAHEARMLG